MGFMTSRTMKVAGIKANVSRSGYTGEDGYEISAAAAKIGEIWDTLLLDADSTTCSPDTGSPGLNAMPVSVTSVPSWSTVLRV